jgi:KipI family sensor histidine kinase inhibitor
VDLARAARQIGYPDAVPTQTTVTIFSDTPPDWVAILEAATRDPAPSVRHRVPVRYDGPDLAEAACQLGLSEASVIALHAGREYECTAVGFQPGFAYLGDLPPELSLLPRRPSPRSLVPAGAVAIAGPQTAIYPGGSPGGWWLIGETDWPVQDPETRIGRISVGDTVQFQDVSDWEVTHPHD